MNPSQDQVKSALRTLLASAGSALAGYVIAKGWVSASEANAILSNQQVMDTATAIVLAAFGSGGALASGIWGMIAHKQANLVATVAKMPEVTKVETVPTAAGIALASAADTGTGPVVVQRS